MVKEEYRNIFIDIIEFDVSDVIVTSGEDENNEEGPIT